MLNEIKVYRRSDAKEIDGEQIRIGFGKSLWLFVGADSSPTEMKFELTKTDPLGKFKQEMEGWWFCGKYIVVEYNPVIECTYYNYIKEKYKVGDRRGKNQTEIDIKYSEIVFDKAENINKYLERWKLEVPFFHLNAGEYSVTELNNLQAQIQSKQAECKKIMQEKENPKYIAFQKFVKDLGMNIEHGTFYEFCYQSIGEDKYIKLLELINQ